LAKNIFGSESAMIRIDMSEYGEKHNVSRMIGSPPGYVGYGEGGQLTEKVRRKPYSIILLDEIEKAHPNVLNIFLQVFEDGHLTDGQGRKVDFKNTIIVMTSNVGSKAASEAPIPVGFNNKSLAREEKTKDIIKKELQSKFTPEFLNRIDDIIVFSKLSKENIHQIIDVETRKLASKLADMGYTLELTTAMKDFLSENGYDSEMGARPLRRAITKWVEDPISEELLRKTIKDKILVDYDTKKGKVLINGNQIIEKKVLSWKLFKM
jgi:ATP-dependent Clp protease ATP-binding subunit ClpC